MSQLSYGIRYLQYLTKAVNKHKVHSPFVFELLTEIISPEHAFYAYEEVEDLREKLLQSDREIEVTDLGAGSRVFKSNTRKISEMTKHTVKPAKFGQLLFRLVNHFSPKTILELGTSFGITTLYLALPDSSATVHTIEGCPETLKIALQNFDALDAKNISTTVGNFDDKLPNVLSDLEQLDFVFFDGNHQQEATLKYFEQCLPKAHNDTVFVFDDIHWSKDMEAAWEVIQQHPKVTVSIDLFYLGLVFFRQEQEEQHFMLKF